MLSLYKKVLLGFLLISGTIWVNAQVTVTNPGNTTPGLAATYVSLAAAISDLNTQTAISGPVTITLDPANPETSPAGGYVINATLAGASAVNSVTFEGSGNTITAPAPAGVSGALNDAIFKFIGSDFMTLQNFVMLENAANTTTTAASNNMIEWGVALLYATTTNGAQNITIQNNTITLNRTYQNTFGIYSNSTHSATTVTTSATATTAAGGNSGLKVYGNTINNVNQGIVVVGPTGIADANDGVDIGGTGGAQANSVTNYGTTGTFSGYANVSGTVNGILVRNATSINVSYNTISSSVGGVTAGTLNGIQLPAFSATPSGTFTQNINSNIISLQSGLITGAMNGINLAGVAANLTSTVNINNNNFSNFGHTVAGTGAITFISNSNGATALATNINSNTFTNITVNTTGSVTFIARSGSMPSGSSENVNSNSIVTQFNKTGAGGTVSFFGANSSSVNGTSMTNNLNNFSNVTVTGATIIAGWSNTEGASSSSGPSKLITNNTFNNITGGSGAVTLITFNFGSATTCTTNTVTNITGTAAISGISIGSSNGQGTVSCSSNTITNLVSSGTGGQVAGIIGGASTVPNCNISSNTITGLSSTGTSSVVAAIGSLAGAITNINNNLINNLSSSGATTGVVDGILAQAGTTINLYRNKIYNLQRNGTPSTNGVCNGIRILAGTTVNAYNNLIGDLRAPTASLTDAVRGISVLSTTASTTYNVYYNTVYLNASSTGTDFGSSGIYHTTSGTSTTAALNLRNNIIVNTSTAAGTGFTAAYRRSSTTLTNYAGTSNNNLFYAGATASPNFIFYDGTTGYQLPAYKTLVSSRDAGSITENPNFLSLVGANANFLHIDPSIATQVEGAAVSIAGITDDYDGDVRNGSTPDIGADEFTGIALDITGPGITYTALVNTACLTAPTFVATITDVSGVNVAPGTKPRLWYRKGSNVNALPATNDNTTDGWKYVEASNAGSPFSFTFDFLLLNGGIPVPGDVIHYFVVAQDLAATPNLGINAGSFATAPPTVALNAGAFPISGNNSFSILTPIATSVTVGGGGTYSTLTDVGGLFEAINAGGLSANTTATILGNITETGTVSLNQVAYGCSGSYTLTIKPDLAVTAVLSGSNATALINLNGADNVIFDGSNNGSTSKDLTIRNTGTGAAIRLINDATVNIIKNTIVESQNSSATSGTIFFSTSTGTLGNSSNSIDNCDVRDRSDAAGVPANAIYSNGSAGALNATNIVSGSNIFNYTGAGVLVAATGAGNGWTVSSNSFYQTAARSAALTGISIQAGNSHSILNNSIGGTAPLAAGTNLATSSTFRGIDLNVGTLSATSVQGNIIKNIRSTYSGFTSSYGITLAAGRANIGNITGNIIGSSNVAERIEANGDNVGINVVSTSSVNISNNVINNMTTSATVPDGEYYYGIIADGAGGTHTIANNTVTNLTNGSRPDVAGAFSTQTIGILVSATGIQTVSGNTVSDMGSTFASASTSSTYLNRIWGMIISATAAGTVVEKNTITNIYGSSASTATFSDVVTCLQSQALANATYRNNMISTSGGAAGSRNINGILDLTAAPSVNTYYFNSVNITGTASSSSNTYAFNRNSTATVTIKNNIFYNGRTGGTGFHVAIANTNAAATGWAATASDYNDIYSATASTTAQWLGSAVGNNRTFAAWKAAQAAGSGGDANSLNIQPNFVSATDLHLVAGTNCGLDGYGTAIAGITTDYDNQTRDVTTPDMGADEFTSTYSGTLAGIAGSAVCENKTVSLAGTTYATNNCDLIARVLPSGADPLAGKANVCVTLDAAQQYFNGEPYVQRHFDIEPVTSNMTTTSATITLYFTDAEFASYNTLNPTWPALPTVAGGANADPNRANVKVTQFHGTATSSPSSPGNYTGVRVLIVPGAANVVWNGSYWAVSFDITGFSGFYVHTNLFNSPLPITINYFNGTKQGNNHLLNWKVTCNSTPRATMILERSSDSRNFTALNSITADALRCNQPFDYTDLTPLKGMNYYRLKMIDADGKISYSSIIALLNAVTGFEIISIAPNPVVGDFFKLNITSVLASKMDVSIIDMQGRLMYKQPVSVIAGYNSVQVNVNKLAAGTYVVQAGIADNKSRVIRFVKQ